MAGLAALSALLHYVDEAIRTISIERGGWCYRHSTFADVMTRLATNAAVPHSFG
jgi:hypothetical protein